MLIQHWLRIIGLIAILSHFGKLFEIILDETLYRAVRYLVLPFHHEFMTMRYTVSYSACITQSIIEILDSKGQGDNYTDLQKAFYMTDHNILLA